MRKFYCRGAKWFDRVNGNTYHNAAIIDSQTGEEFYIGFAYGYGDHWFYRCKEEIQRRHPRLKKYEVVKVSEIYTKKSDCKKGNF